MAELTLAEDEAESGYQNLTQQNKVTKASLEQDVKYKGENSVALKKEVGEWTGDKDSATAELSAVVTYLSKLNDMRVTKAEPYAETVRRRTSMWTLLCSRTLSSQTAKCEHLAPTS